MSRYVPNTYRNHQAIRIILRIIIAIVIVAAVLFVSLFFGLKKYIVYGADGLRLEIPFLMEEEQSAEPSELTE